MRYLKNTFWVSGLLVAAFLFVANGIGGTKNLTVTEVLTALNDEGYPDVSVSIPEAGTVELTGSVNLMYDKYRVFDIVAKLPKVKKISNQVLVNTETLPDNEIRDNIIREIEYIQTIQDPDDIRVSVDNGVVHLQGRVDFYREKLMAQTAASWQQGVKGIVNDIQLVPTGELKTDAHIKGLVTEVIKTRFPLEKKSVDVMVENGVVTLTGGTTSFWAKGAIEKDVSHLVGVKKVINGLYVKESEEF